MLNKIVDNRSNINSLNPRRRAMNEIIFAYLCLLHSSLPQNERNTIAIADDGFMECIKKKGQNRFILAKQKTHAFSNINLSDYKYFLFPFFISQHHIVLGKIDNITHKLKIYESQMPSNLLDYFKMIREFIASVVNTRRCGV